MATLPEKQPDASSIDNPSQAAPTTAAVTSPKKSDKLPMVSLRQLFRYITHCEIALNLLSYLAAAANGIIMPVCV